MIRNDQRQIQNIIDGNRLECGLKWNKPSIDDNDRETDEQDAKDVWNNDLLAMKLADRFTYCLGSPSYSKTQESDEMNRMRLSIARFKSMRREKQKTNSICFGSHVDCEKAIFVSEASILRTGSPDRFSTIERRAELARDFSERVFHAGITGGERRTERHTFCSFPILIL